MIDIGADGMTMSEQVSLILTPSVLISFQESAGRLFDPIRERLRKDRGRIRSSGGDYLAYALLDAVVDHYFVILEQIAQKIDEAEEETMSRPCPDTAKRIHALKRTVIFLHRHIWPLREVVGAMAREGNPVIQDSTRVFLRDVHDHSLQVIDTVEAFRDVLSNLLDIYLSTVSNRMNEIMKVLTMIATLFIPVTFVVGLYGMNFKHMPELEWPWGYPMVWGVMIAMMAGMLVYFKKKNWF
jgi:magnesium transporter